MNDEGKLLTMIRYAGSDAGREAYDSMLVELARLRAIEASVDRMTSAKDLDPTGVCNWCGEECSNAFCRPECYRSYRVVEVDSPNQHRALDPMRPESMTKITCEHPALSVDTLRVCREIARGVADYQRDTSGHEQRDYAAIQDREERYWHARAVRCKADHGAYDIAHPGCQLCPSVHGLPYEMVR